VIPLHAEASTGAAHLELHDVAVVQRLEQRDLLAELIAGGVALVPQHLDRHRVDALQHRLVHLRHSTDGRQLSKSFIA
jgi:hypothetical protein